MHIFNVITNIHLKSKHFLQKICCIDTKNTDCFCLYSTFFHNAKDVVKMKKRGFSPRRYSLFFAYFNIGIMSFTLSKT